MVFESMIARGHETLVFCHDDASGLRGIIAIHNTTLGPALGGTRRWAYKSEAAAIEDVLRLSEAMTYKAAAADLPMGGAKSVIWTRSPDEKPTESLARAMGRAVERMGGIYIAAEDVGVNTQFIDWMAEETKFVMGGEKVAAGGDPAPFTALGVVSGMRGALRHVGRSKSLKDVVIAVQGLGALGRNVCQIAAGEGAKLLVTDIREELIEDAVKRFGATAVPVDEIISAECDILCPCALGQVITANNIASLRCKIVAPGANNVLDDPDEDAAMLSGRSIIYCPDFVNNGGGLLQLAGLWCGFSAAELDRRIRNIENVIEQILKDAEKMSSAHAAALEYAKKRLEAGRKGPSTPRVRTTKGSATSAQGSA
ncbi:MAG: Glu/Leu/Phe/Val dehydrogenase [Phycisphaeraceae bacterium]|nr:MAG: Glu/Leu/Phe/Val dehydrogenase [Phycisphaeraceae bacterium]